jgi:hypothetical protein
MAQYSIRHFTAKQVNAAGYSGSCGGAVHGAHYAIYKEGKGFVSLDGGKTVYMLVGKTGRKAMENILKSGGFVGQVDYRQNI